MSLKFADGEELNHFLIGLQEVMIHVIPCTCTSYDHEVVVFVVVLGTWIDEAILKHPQGMSCAQTLIILVLLSDTDTIF